jgi:hypothetical protein
MDDRLADSLAQKLYEAHMEWRATLSEVDHGWTRWFATRDESKDAYLAAARALDGGVEERKSRNRVAAET